MRKLRVGVLRGGPSSEYEVSLKSGAHVLEHLPEDKYIPIDIFISKSGEWHIGGVPISVSDVAVRTDLVWIALHGTYGEDGKVQRILDQLGVPYTGSGALASAIGMNKSLTKSWLEGCGVLMPKGECVMESDSAGDSAIRISKVLPFPLIVKPASAGSSVGVHVVTEVSALTDAIVIARKFSTEVLVEEFIQGREATCCVVEGGGKQVCYALYPTEILASEKNTFFDFEAKYNGQTQEICPGDFSIHQNQEIRRIATLVHRKLGLRHFSRSDFIVTPEKVYLLEVNTLPGLTPRSLLPQALHVSGVEFSEFLHHVITRTLSPR